MPASERCLSCLILACHGALSLKEEFFWTHVTLSIGCEACISLSVSLFVLKSSTCISCQIKLNWFREKGWGMKGDVSMEDVCLTSISVLSAVLLSSFCWTVWKLNLLLQKLQYTLVYKWRELAVLLANAWVAGGYRSDASKMKNSLEAIKALCLAWQQSDWMWVDFKRGGEGPFLVQGKPLFCFLTVDPFFPFRMKESFVVTSSQDCTIKVWSIPESLISKAKAALISSPEALHAQVTERGHDKVKLHLMWEHIFST